MIKIQDPMYYSQRQFTLRTYIVRWVLNARTFAKESAKWYILTRWNGRYILMNTALAPKEMEMTGVILSKSSVDGTPRSDDGG